MQLYNQIQNPIILPKPQQPAKPTPAPGDPLPAPGKHKDSFGKLIVMHAYTFVPAAC